MAQQVDIGVICLNDWMPNYEEKRNRITSFKAAFLYQPSKDGKSDYWEYGYAPVGAAFFILGFPLGLALRGTLPIWKRGSGASEPLVNRRPDADLLWIRPRVTGCLARQWCTSAKH
ncbi:hypothetical protein [Bradyrhizobium sp. CCBAU 51745]|uniref:hypothetical protein n=1 Tax=Bradyrhizobium sp. CCBAU 51745 TaxID=1325099 RepID=UPI0023063784|nr:hypothetical protein [Bradyrhizobium sp. CCBAU 51745]